MRNKRGNQMNRRVVVMVQLDGAGENAGRHDMIRRELYLPDGTSWFDGVVRVMDDVHDEIRKLTNNDPPVRLAE